MGKTVLVVVAIAVVAIGIGAIVYFATQPGESGDHTPSSAMDNAAARASVGDTSAVAGGLVAAGTPSPGFEEALARLNSEAPEGAGLTYASVVGLENGQGMLRTVTFSPEPGQRVTIEELGVYALEVENDVPTRLHLVANGVRPDSASAPPDLDQQLQSLGYEKAPAMNIEIDFAINTAAGTMDINTFSMGAKEFGRVVLEINLAGLPDPAALQADPGASMGALMGMSLGALRVTYEDDSLVGRAIATQAAQAGISAEELQETAAQNLALMAGQLNSELVDTALAEVRAFLAEPKRLVVSVNPETPFPFAQAMMLPTMMAQGGESSAQVVDRLLRQLNFQVRAN